MGKVVIEIFFFSYTVSTIADYPTDTRPTLFIHEKHERRKKNKTKKIENTSRFENISFNENFAKRDGFVRRPLATGMPKREERNELKIKRKKTKL